MTGLRSIAYLSSVTRPMTEIELEALLVDARDFNREHDVTGVLLYFDGMFMQYFEGGDEAVSQVYKRVIDSSRHKNILELVNQRVEARSFPDWLMGLARPKESELLKIQTASWKGTINGKNDSLGFLLLKNFWNRCQRYGH